MIVPCLLATCAWTAAAEKPRVYTNDDLERVAPYRDQTGVNQKPAAPPAREAVPPRPRAAQTDVRDESYWRREADRTAKEVRGLRVEAAELADRVGRRRREQGVLPYSDPEVVALEAKRWALEEEAREAQNKLEERARRAGALPGWLR